MDRNKIIRALVVLVAMLSAQTIYAQSNDFGIWYSLGAEKKLSKKWSLGAEAELRTRNDARTIDRWSVGVEGDYKIMKHLKAFAGVKYLRDNNIEKINYDDDGDVKNWRPSYYGNRFRTQVGVTGDIDWGRFNISLREMWQYTYRPENTTCRYDMDSESWEDHTVGDKGKSQLRSRLQVEYNIRHSKIDPYASVELFNEMTLTKVRYTIGADWRIVKHHSVGIYYRYQKVNNDDTDGDVNCHIIGLGYKFKF